MPRTATLLVATMLLVLAPAADADVHAGSIVLGTPAFGAVPGPTELLYACDEGAPTTGVDAAWFDIAGEGSSFTLVMAVTLDVDVYFYDAACGFLDSDVGAQGFLGETESGPVPSAAAFAVVVGYAGSGTFTLSVA